MGGKKNIIICILLAVILIAPIAAVEISGINDLHWDFKVYYYTAKADSLGVNPFDRDEVERVTGERIYGYAYPPPTLAVIRILSFFEYDNAVILYLAFKAIALMGLLWIWMSIFLEGKFDIYYFPFLVFAFNLAIIRDLTSGNISVFAQLVLWVGFYFFLKKRYWIFISCVLAVSFIKLTPMIFLGLLLLERDKKCWRLIPVAGLIYCIYIAISGIFFPVYFSDYLGNINFSSTLEFERGVINPATLPFIEDLITHLGMSIGGKGLSIVLYFCTVVAILSVSYKAIGWLERSDEVDKEKLKLFFLLAMIVLVMPRFKDYSYILLILPAYYIFKRDAYAKFYPYTTLTAYFMVPLHNSEIQSWFYLIGYIPYFMTIGIWIMYILEFKRLGRTREGVKNG